MFKSVEIKNFQSHKNTKLEFVPALNIIKGQNEQGKTAVIRALNWVINNVPSGGNFRSKFCDKSDQTVVGVLLEDRDGKHAVTRTKGNKTNKYEVDGTDIRAFGQTVPDEVKSVLNISDINLQLQLDEPFLLCGTSGEVGRYFNKIIGFDVADRSQTNLDKTKKAVKDKIDTNIEQKIQLEKELDTYDNLEELEHKINCVLGKEKRIRSAETRVERIVLENNLLESLKIKKEKYTHIIKFKDKVETLLSLRLKIDKLCALKEQYKNEINTLNKLKVKSKKLESYKCLSGKVDKLLDLSKSGIELKRELDTLSSAYCKYKTLSEKYLNITDTIKELEEEFASKFPDVCPLCGRS